MSDSKNGVYAGIDSSINRTFYELGVNDRTPVKNFPVAQAKTVSRAYNSEGWDKVVDEVMDYMYSKEGIQWVNNRVSTYKEAYKKVSSETNNRDAATEFVNDVIGEIFTTKEGLEHLMDHAKKNLNQKEQKSFIQSIKDFFNNMIKLLKDYMESHSR